MVSLHVPHVRGGRHGAESKYRLTALSSLTGSGALGFLFSCEPTSLILLLAIVKDIDVADRVEVLHYLRMRLLRGALSEISVRGGAILFDSSHCRHKSLASQASRWVLFITKCSMSPI